MIRYFSYERNIKKHIYIVRDMDPRTAKGQRKIRIPSKLMNRKKKEVVIETPEPSCQDTGCGCGN